MKKGLYRTLAWSGMKKNKTLYIPYILTGIGMVMMAYILCFLSRSPVVYTIRGGDTVQQLLSFGFGVICVFSLIFLFYTNSFLIRRRKKEFGLYNVLGMGKRELIRIFTCESVMNVCVTVFSGIVFGIIFSKIAELCLVRILDGEVTFTLSVDGGAILKTCIFFTVIFVLVYANGVRQVYVTDPIRLLRSEQTGEKPPGSNRILACVGLALLAAAYYMAVVIRDPMDALIWFFVAVVMVIAATYMLFVAGAVTACRLLQKNKAYYYKTNHFVSISSMVFRMKRNGAGLASICILCTMVLVTLSSTVALYVGAEESLRVSYPRDMRICLQADSAEELHDGTAEQIKETVDRILRERNVTASETEVYRVGNLVALLGDGKVVLDGDKQGSIGGISQLCHIAVVPLDEYNAVTGEHIRLEEGEALMYSEDPDSFVKDEDNVFEIGDHLRLRIKKRLTEFPQERNRMQVVVKGATVIVPDLESVYHALESYKYANGNPMFSMQWMYEFNVACDDGEQIALQHAIRSEVVSSATETERRFSVECIADERSSFYALNGSLLFLGVLLGGIFLVAAVLIIYYKQICEGYEDRSRFAVMRKVGITKREIRKSVNSQVLTVFFLPLIMGGIHLIFAFSIIRRLLILFGLLNIVLLAAVTAICYVIFALFYTVVYRMTSRKYYSIVTSPGNDML